MCEHQGKVTREGQMCVCYLQLELPHPLVLALAHLGDDHLREGEGRPWKVRAKGEGVATPREGKKGGRVATKGR